MKQIPFFEAHLWNEVVVDSALEEYVKVPKINLQMDIQIYVII